jgi:ribosomal protein L37E
MPGACARCGSTLLQHVSHEEGEFAYEEAASECLHCGFTGEPKMFRTTQDLENFRLTVRHDF